MESTEPMSIARRSMLVLALVVPSLLGVLVFRNWFEARTDQGNLFVVATGLDDAYGWVVLSCVLAYLALFLIRLRYPLLTSIVLSISSLVSLVAAREHYENIAGQGETTTAFTLALAAGAVWSVQSILALLFWRGARTAGFTELGYFVRALTRVHIREQHVRGLLDFRIMLAPWLIRAAFVLGVVASGIGGSVRLVDGVVGADWDEAVFGLGVLVLGPIVIRLVCEYSILFFRINETLNDVKGLIKPDPIEPVAPASVLPSPPARATHGGEFSRLRSH